MKTAKVLDLEIRDKKHQSYNPSKNKKRTLASRYRGKKNYKNG